MTKTRRYTVVLEQSDDGWIFAYFPALRGVVTQGRTREETLENAREVLEMTLECMVDEGESIPEDDYPLVEAASLEVAF